MGAIELSQSTTTGLSNEVANLRTESVDFWNLSLGDMNLFSNSFSRSSLVSLMGRAMYQFKDRYLLRLLDEMVLPNSKVRINGEIFHQLPLPGECQKNLL